jgi:transaldolase
MTSTVATNALGELAAAGQSVWLDSISRNLIESGTLLRYINDLYVTGVTSNPSILHQAIGAGEEYVDSIRALIDGGTTDEESIAFALALGDLVPAADLLLASHRASGGADGFVSIEVSPTLLDDAEGTIAAGTQLFADADRPNVMIKVPGTAAGLEAAEELLAAGIPVNVTLLFSPDHYAATADAYLTAMERRVDAGLTPRVASVASVFVSRWDAAADPQLPEEQQGRLGLALMQEILATYRDTLATPRFTRLRDAGAFAQRVLWASTGTKNPALPDTYYLGRLVARGTVDTVPEQTLLAYADHGVTCDLMEPDHAQALTLIEAVREAGVDVEQLGNQLQTDGGAAFNEAWADLLASIHTYTN